MPTSRLKNDTILLTNENKSYFGYPRYVQRVRDNINSGNIRLIETVVLTEEQRLDIISGQKYGDARYWWVIAIASGIGYGLQVPPGTVLVIPNLGDVLTYI